MTTEKTTITLVLEPDVATRLAERARETERSIEQVVHEALQRDLRRPAPGEIPPYRMKTYAMKPKPGLDFDDIGDLLELVEGPRHR